MVIASVAELGEFADRIRYIHAEADRLFYEGRVLKNWHKWHDFVNEKAEALPENVQIEGEAEVLLRAYSDAIEDYRSNNAFLANVAGSLWAIARFNIVGAALNIAKIGQYLNGLNKLKQSTKQFGICYSIERQYAILNANPQRQGIVAICARYSSLPSAYGPRSDYNGGTFLESS